MPQPLDAWARLESENLGKAGVFQLRIFGESSLNLFGVLELPERRVGIQLQVPSRLIPAVGEYPSTAGFRTRSERIASTTRIVVLLEVQEFRGVFGEMCIDVLRACLRAGSDETKAVHALVDRLIAWKELFRGSGPIPLPEREQMGLFGELTFLETLLDRSVPAATALEGWRGPFHDPHDFHLGSVHVEVKATASMDPGVTQISSLEQLDPAGTQALFLWHYRFQTATDGSGRTLRGLVEKLRVRLEAAGPHIRAAFDDCLLKIRYLDLHAAEHYDLIGLGLCQTRTLRICHGFPGLTHESVPAPVRAARYDLSVDMVSSEHDVRLEDAMEEICSGAFTRGSDPGGGRPPTS